MIAIDSSALAAFILKEPGWEGLARYIKIYIEKPLTRSSLYRGFERHVEAIYEKSHRQDTALKLHRTLRLLEEINVKTEPARMYMDKAPEIALDTGLTIYNALYIALGARIYCY